MQHIGVQRTGIEDQLLTLLLSCKGEVGDFLLQIVNIRSLLLIGDDIRLLKFQFLLHFLDGRHSFFLVFSVLAHQALPAILSKAVVMVQVVTGQVEVHFSHFYAFAALCAAEDAIASGSLTLGFVLQPQWVDEATLAIAFLAAVPAAVDYLIDDARPFAFFALICLQLMLHSHYFPHRQLPPNIFRVAFEQIHPHFPLTL